MQILKSPNFNLTPTGDFWTNILDSTPHPNQKQSEERIEEFEELHPIPPAEFQRFSKKIIDNMH